MFCTDDCHPDDLLAGHINNMVKKAIDRGYDIFDILQISSVNPIKHYGLNVGLLQPGDSADFIVVDGLNRLNVLATYIDGIDVLKQDMAIIEQKIPTYAFPKSFDSTLLVKHLPTRKVKVIDVVQNELITNWHIENLNTDFLEANLQEDILKITVSAVTRRTKHLLALLSFGFKKEHCCPHCS
jgi:adenine deaminase